ncbi:hypothetical protein C2E21_2778 [Chlorella sorokiniana]|uniref:Uncharacterized protein n=1 Tax=Chlorella sorokiniana TaxID=3076 RepID=A0A2P6TWW6_CHLSO|nr:hypothetical protein C2E21_2778 [Chlorella sorokiniana]|eukprot:PRW58552.1 hypothetical protein C2E21_2778 [Chlorella sorokiniana]
MLWYSWYRSTGLILWPRSKRLLVATAADLPFQLLRLHNMLNPAGAQPPDMPAWAAWASGPVATALARLQYECEPTAAGAEGGEEDEDAWLDGLRSDDEDWDSLARTRRQQVEDSAARALWGPQPPTTPQQLAAALAGAVAQADAAVVTRNRESLALLVKLVCQMGDMDVGASLLKASKREPCCVGYGTNPQEAILRMCAHFGWPAAWLSLLGQLLAAHPIPWSSWQGLTQTKLIERAVQIEARFPSTDDNGARSKKALGAMALGLAVAVRTQWQGSRVMARRSLLAACLPSSRFCSPSQRQAPAWRCTWWLMRC